MTKDPGTRSTADGSRQNMIKALLAVVIIAACGVWLAYVLRPAPAVVIPEPQDPSALWLKAYAANTAEHAATQDEIYRLSGTISVLPTEDKQSVIISGRVPSAADLAKFKAEMAKIQPPLNIDWKVTVGR